MTIALKVEELSNDFGVDYGKSLVVIYKITNVAAYPVQDIKVNASTVNPRNEFTKGNYIESVSKPVDRLLPKQFCEVEIKLSIPEDYNETYLNDSKNVVIAPMRLLVKASGRESIREHW